MASSRAPTHMAGRALLLALAASVAFAEPRERIYTVVGRVRLPHHGLVEHAMTVSLADAEGWTRMAIHKGSEVRGGSAHHGQTSDPHDLHAHPFFFRRHHATGAITEVQHSPLEGTEALRQKKALTACHQLVLGDGQNGEAGEAAAATPPAKGRSWHATEDDVLGPAHARYSVRRALGSLSRRTLVRKQLNFVGEPAVPDGFAHEVNQTTLIDLDGRGDAITIRQSALLHSLPSAFEDKYFAPGSSRKPAELEGFDALPTEPSELVWTLVHSQPLPPSRRRLYESAADRAGFVSSPLRHASHELMSMHELRAKREEGASDDGQSAEEEAADEADEETAHASVSAAGVIQPAHRPKAKRGGGGGGDTHCSAAALQPLLECLHRPEAVSDEDRLHCVRALRVTTEDHRSHCLEPVLAALQSLLLSGACEGTMASRCGSVVNALQLVASDADELAIRLAACEAFGAWVAQPLTAASLPQEAFTAMVVQAMPCAKLMEAAIAHPVGALHDAAREERLLLAAAAMARKAHQEVEAAHHAAAGRSTHGRATGIATPTEEATPQDQEAAHRARRAAAAAAIGERVLAVLSSAAGASAGWEAAHAEADAAARAHWATQLSGHEKEGWISHHAVLPREGLQWAHSRGELSAHEATARAALKTHLLHTAHPTYNADQEHEHTRQLISALRAVGNLGLPPRLPPDENGGHGDAGDNDAGEERRPAEELVRHLQHAAQHRAPSVVEATMVALRKMHSHPAAEATLLAVLRRRHPSERAARRKAAATLLEWPQVGAKTAADAVGLLLRTPLRDVDLCARSCVARCNPHARGTACKEECMERCGHEADMALSLSQLVQKAVSPSGTPGGRDYKPPAHDLAPLLELHAPAASPSRLAFAASHGAQRTRPAWASSVVHPELRTVGNRTAAELARLVQAAPSRLLGVEEEEAAAARREAHLAPVPRGRALKWDWSKVDFDDFSLTFIDLILSHKPLDWNKQFGDPNLLGKIGGAGAGAMVRVANSAWLRVGLFGGGFGLSLDNRAEAGAYLVNLNVELFKAVLEFKVDMTYKVPIPQGVLNLAEDIIAFAGTAMAQFDSLKEVVMGYARKFANWLRKIKNKIYGILDRIGGNVTSMLTNAFPKLVRGAAKLLGKIFGLIEDAAGLKEGLIQSGLVAFVDALDKAVDTVSRVTTNSSLALGIRNGVDKVDAILDDTIGLIQYFVNNASFEEIVHQGTAAAASLLRGAINRRANKCARQAAEIAAEQAGAALPASAPADAGANLTAVSCPSPKNLTAIETISRLISGA